MPKQIETSCPHVDIQFCPLYIAAHDATVGGCDDGNLGEGSCAVSRGMNYRMSVARLNPAFVAQCRFKEEAQQAEQQRQRNMRAAGIH